MEDEDRCLNEAKGRCEGAVSGIGSGLKGSGGDSDSVEVFQALKRNIKITTSRVSPKLQRV